MGPVDVLGWVLAAAGSVPMLLQLRHTRSLHTAEGVSADTHVAWLLSWVAWTAYGTAIGSWPVAAGSLVGAVVEVAQVRSMSRLGVALGPAARRWVAVAVGAVSTVAGVAVAGVAGAVAAGAVVLAAYDAVGLVPQVVAAWRDPSLAGLSARAWVASLALSGGWVVYAVGVGHPMVASWSVLYSLAAAAVLVATRTRRAGAAPHR